MLKYIKDMIVEKDNERNKIKNTLKQLINYIKEDSEETPTEESEETPTEETPTEEIKIEKVKTTKDSKKKK